MKITNGRIIGAIRNQKKIVIAVNSENNLDLEHLISDLFLVAAIGYYVWKWR